MSSSKRLIRADNGEYLETDLEKGNGRGGSGKVREEQIRVTTIMWTVKKGYDSSCGDDLC